MSRSTYFVQQCPTCGRTLQVRVEYLGRHLVCQHCHGRFVARDPSNVLHGSDDLMARADQLLTESAIFKQAQVEQQRPVA